MPDFGAPVAQNVNVNPGQGIQTLSGLIGLQQQQQQLQTGQYIQQSAQAHAIQQQQVAKETQAGSSLLSDPVGNGIIDKDGNPTANAQTIIQQAMPTTGSQHYEGLVKAAQAKVELTNSANNLRSNERGEIANVIGGAAADPKTQLPDVLDQLNGLVESKKGTSAYGDYQTIANTAKDVLAKAATHPAFVGQQQGQQQDPWRTAALGLQRTVLGAPGVVGPGGVGTPGNVTVDQGPVIQPGVQAPALAGGGITPSGPAIRKGLTPGEQLPHQVKTGAGIVNVTPGGTISAPPQAGGGGPPGMGLNPTDAQVAAATDTSKGVAQSVDGVRTADQDYGTNQHINDQLLALSKDTTTGYGSEGWRKAIGYISGGRISSPDFQTIGAYLDRSAALAAHSMGVPNTNAGLATAAGATGTTEYSAPALQTKVKLAQALNNAQHQYRQGVDKAVGQGPSPDPTAYNQFRSDWSNNFDPRLFLMEDAHRRGDQAESQQVASTMSPQDKSALQQKRINLLSLAQTGHLPQPDKP
jgi:hypothetical protein